MQLIHFKKSYRKINSARKIDSPYAKCKTKIYRIPSIKYIHIRIYTLLEHTKNSKIAKVHKQPSQPERIQKKYPVNIIKEFSNTNHKI